MDSNGTINPLLEPIITPSPSIQQDEYLLRASSKIENYHHRGVNTLETRNDETDLLHEEVALPNMWSLDYIGLYSQYAAIGLLYGTGGALYPLCIYFYDGPSNTCANASSITYFAWNFKIVFAIITDIYRPFGMRRRPWMIFGWCGALILLFILAVIGDKLSASAWLVILMLIQFFAMFSDVPADGYSVELGQLESYNQRGVILATGQMIRFSFSVLAGFIQCFFLNGPTTNPPDCEISFQGCWSFGLTINGYYGLLFALVFVLALPILKLKELDATNIPQHSFSHFVGEIWETLQNLTTLYVLIFAVGLGATSNFISVVNIYMQYYIIQLTNFQAGIDTITTYVALSVAIWLFKTFLINRNWRYTQYGSYIVSSLLGLLWILVYYNVGGLQDPWFTIFIDLDQSFVTGLTQVLFSLAVIELSKPGLEATTYELLITVINAASTVSTIIATQLLSPLKCVACGVDGDESTCSSKTVDLYSPETFISTNGPYRYTIYSLVLMFISIGSCLIFTTFLPTSKQHCLEWKKQGESVGTSQLRGILSAIIVIITIAYGFCIAVLLLIPSTSCLAVVGGEGC